MGYLLNTIVKLSQIFKEFHLHIKFDNSFMFFFIYMKYLHIK